MTNYSDPLIYGKDITERIVSIEANDNHLELFLKNDDGTTSSKFVSNKFWILSDEKIDNKWVRLKGDLHYKWGRQFAERRDYNSSKARLKNKYDIYTITDPRENTLVNKGITMFKGLTPSDLSVLSFDIETTGIKHNLDSKLLIIANTFRNKGPDGRSKVYRKLFCYNDYSDEGAMLTHWINWIRKLDPDILIAHNGISFDLPYIQYIADKFNVTLNLGRNGSRMEFYPYESKFRIDGNRDQEYNNIRIYGREIIDTMFLAIRYDQATKKYESYGLKNIIAHEKLEAKDRQFYDAATIKDNYTNPIEWEKIKKYAEFDGDDALALFDLMIPAYFYFNQSVPKTFQQMILSASGSQLNSILVRSYLQNGHSIPKASEVNHFQGAISWGGSGVYDNAVRFDFASMYPSIIIQYEIYNKAKDPDGNFLKMVNYFTQERLKNKQLYIETNDQYYKDLEQTQKIGINSAYGLLGTKVNFNYIEGASLVTEKGRELLEFCVKYLTGKTLEEYGYLQDSVQIEQ